MSSRGRVSHAEAAFLACGLSAKIFPWQIPEFVALCVVLNTALDRLRGQAAHEVALVIARLFVLVRGIRGTQGVHWLASVAREAWGSWQIASENGKHFFGASARC